MPKETPFFDLFERHAATLVDGAAALRSLLDGTQDLPRAFASIAAHEDKADTITQEALQAVRRTFITPFDRSDIQDLVGSLDDAIDQMLKMAKAVRRFEVTRFEAEMREMGVIIEEAAAVVAEALPKLRALNENAADLNVLTERVIRLEGRADDLHEAGLKALYQASRQDPMAFIVGSELYDHLEKVMDRFEDVANQISSIVVEHV
ncbi:uncharacterized protein Yka (UPF0111/DUF47 family) [Methylobacterium aerolatum]|uniref:Uncharacterized protein Yka (UPF0111/DUF47 family) n=2 Tax=Methylobacterium aerolatum TaxID=418708 RepID=A0ABU0I255_9HYPH|nr:uncharacterized protein Yka (UPF0111/DUF47 family) [Methylobacterium aerolatum]